MLRNRGNGRAGKGGRARGPSRAVLISGQQSPKKPAPAQVIGVPQPRSRPAAIGGPAGVGGT